MEAVSDRAEAKTAASPPPRRSLIVRWGAVLLAGLIIFLLPHPSAITTQSWGLLAIFVATIVGMIVQPMPGGAMVLLGITAIILTRVLPVRPELIGTGNIETLRIKEALAGYADPVVWLVLAALRTAMRSCLALTKIRP